MKEILFKVKEILLKEFKELYGNCWIPRDSGGGQLPGFAKDFERVSKVVLRAFHGV